MSIFLPDNAVTSHAICIHLTAIDNGNGINLVNNLIDASEILVIQPLRERVNAQWRLCVKAPLGTGVAPGGFTARRGGGGAGGGGAGPRGAASYITSEAGHRAKAVPSQAPRGQETPPKGKHHHH